MTANEQRVRDALAAMERGDVDAIVAGSEPDVEFVNPPTAIEPGTRHGHDGLKLGLEGMLDVFDNLRIEPHRIDDLGDRVLVIGEFSGRGRASGVRFDSQPFGFVVTLRDGRMTRYEWFASQEEAFRAAGIEPA